MPALVKQEKKCSKAWNDGHKLSAEFWEKIAQKSADMDEKDV